MRFRDLLYGGGPKKVGEVVQAEWDAAERGIRFVIRFMPSGRRLEGVCRAGVDPNSGNFVSETDLRAKLKTFREIEVFEDMSGSDPNTLSPEDFKQMKIEFSLSTLSIRASSNARPISSNTFLSRLFR
jgi:hypothetical protein